MTVLRLGVTPLATNKCWGVNGVHPTVVIRCGGHSVDNLLSGAMACHSGTSSHFGFAFCLAPMSYRCAAERDTAHRNVQRHSDGDPLPGG